MHDEHSQLTRIGTNAQSERVLRTAELLRTELTSFVQADALSEILDLAAKAAENTLPDDVLREMRASVAGMLLNRVGAFMVATQTAIESADRITRPPVSHKRAAA